MHGGQPQPTEDRNPRSAGLDRMDSRRIVALMHDEDVAAVRSLQPALEDIARAADLARDALGGGGRLVYVGAGTSGRVAAMDAAEVPPTFGLPEGRVVAVLAGGNDSLLRAVEGAEDQALEAVATIRDMLVGRADCVVGISASGTTRFVLGALGEARERGASTVLVTSGRPPARGLWTVSVVVETGPEVLTGSTRLKAATAAKLVLNMISTAAMAQLGRVHDNLMVEAASLNAKLGRRAVRTVGWAAEVDATRAVALLRSSDGEVKTAIAMERLSVDPAEARRRLAAAGGSLRAVLGGP